MSAASVTAGSPEPLGVTLTETGVNVAVASGSALAIDFCLFEPDGSERRVRLPERTGDVFHGHVAGVREGARYGLRAHGVYAPEAGLRFDARKLLVDPYAVALDRPFSLDPSLFAEPPTSVDTAPVTPKAVVTPQAAPAEPPIVVPWDRTFIYEAHVRGLTKLHPAVPEDIRGTFAALGHPAIIDHLTKLGITTLELLPTAAWVDERHLPPLGLTNYWGYNPVAFCAPDPRLAPGGWAEVRAATEALAKAGIETILDVVFNHTGEGDELGPTLSLRGLDNRGYYWLDPDDPARYLNYAGTGNTLRLDRSHAVRLVMEAMRTWAQRGGVAGFRFDLAPVLGRGRRGFDPAAPLLIAIDQDPLLRRLKLIAEPWDLGPDGHQLGCFPAAWGEWSDRYRDDIRNFWRGSGAVLGDLAHRLAGSEDLFAAKRRPSRSVNFITAHDGFTLADLVSYERKQNEANGEAGRDGTAHNASWNNGVEGPTDDPQIQERRLQDQRALLALLLASRGAPMITAGAELGQSQGGNNNAYAQDNALSWIDWTGAEAGLDIFVSRLARIRREHPALRDDHFLTGLALAGPCPDVEWRAADGAALTPRDWENPQGAALQMVLSVPLPSGGLDRVAVVVNRGEEAMVAHLPEPSDGRAWRILADSADPQHEETLGGASFELPPRSVILAAETASRRRTPMAADEDIARLAGAAGIAPEWSSLDGERHAVSVETNLALLHAMGLPARSRGEVRESLWRLSAPDRAVIAPVRLAPENEPTLLRIGAAEAWLTVEDQEGGASAVPIEDGEARLPPLPSGRYRLQVGDAQGELIVHPRRCYEPGDLAEGRRIFGLAAQVYALRRDGDQGMGDFTALRELGGLARRAGAGLIALNPLHAMFPGDRARTSPYQPSDRRFVDPLYLDVSEVAPAEPFEGEPLLVDYPSVWSRKAAALAQAAEIAARPEHRAGFDAFVRDQGQALADFCAFQLISEEHPGKPWMQWPLELQDPSSQAVAELVSARAERLRHHQALQWLCDRQLAAAAAAAPGLGFCRDLAVGAAPDGAEAWAAAGRLAMGASIGAPPDQFAPQGQVWGLPPPNPHHWRTEAYRSFSELLRANMRHAGAVRIDHVLGLSRLFWVPEGADGAHGAYVAYPQEDLLAVLALESQQARCLVVGEDLGTVPEGLRDALSETGVYRYSVLPFERTKDGGFQPPRAYPARALACVSTHDIPPLAGWWEGKDLDERLELGLIGEDQSQSAADARRNEKTALLEAMAELGEGQAWSADSPFSPELAAAIYAFVADAPSRILMVQLEDLAGERIGVNLPGTDRERPNWKRRLGLPLAQLSESPLWSAILQAVTRARPPA